jgi:ABC-2 type transport system permease protein
MRTETIRRLKALMKKERFQIFRDPSSLLITIFLPLLLLFLYGYGVSLDLDHVRIGLVLEDTAPDAQRFAKSLTDSKYFDVKIARDRRELYKDLEEGSLRGIVVVPTYFSQFRSRPTSSAPIQVIADGSEANTANFVQNYVQGAFQNWVAQEAISDALAGLPLIEPVPRFWYNEQLESRYFLLPGSLAIIMTLIGALLTSLVVAREWERGTMEALISTEVRVPELIAGKAIPYFILGFASMAICTLVSVGYYGIPLRGSLLALGLVSAAFLFSALGTGFLISTLCKVQVLASQITIFVAFLPAYILSGFLFEICSMPFPIRLLTCLMPARYFVQSLQTLFLVGNVWSIILLNTAVMFLFGFVLFYIIVKKTVKRLD